MSKQIKKTNEPSRWEDLMSSELKKTCSGWISDTVSYVKDLQEMIKYYCMDNSLLYVIEEKM